MEITTRIEGLEDISCLNYFIRAINERIEVACWHQNASRYDFYNNFTGVLPYKRQYTRAKNVNNIARAVEMLIDYYADMEADYISGSYANFPKSLREKYLNEPEKQIGNYILAQNETFSPESMTKYQNLLSCCAYWLGNMNHIPTNKVGCTQFWPRLSNWIDWQDSEPFTRMHTVVEGNYPNTALKLYYRTEKDWSYWAEWNEHPAGERYNGLRYLSGYTGMYVDNRVGYAARCATYLTLPFIGDWYGGRISHSTPPPLTDYYVCQAPKWRNVAFECQMPYNLYRDEDWEHYSAGLIDYESAKYGIFGHGGAAFERQLESIGHGTEYHTGGDYEGYAYKRDFWDFRTNWDLNGHHDYVVNETEWLSSWEGRDGPHQTMAHSYLYVTANLWNGFGYWEWYHTPKYTMVPANTKMLVTPKWSQLPDEPMTPDWSQFDHLSKWKYDGRIDQDIEYDYIYEVHAVPILDFTDSFTQIRLARNDYSENA